MAKQKENRDIVKIEGNSLVPSWLEEEMASDSSLEAMQEYRVLPRIKVLQSTSDADLLAEFDAGSCILQPGKVLLAEVDRKEKKGKPFLFVPVFFFPEFIKWADLKDKESNSVMERSLDSASPLAAMCKNPNTREEVYNGTFKARYCEHLNFAGYVYSDDSPLSGTLICVSFSRGEFSNGRNWISAITMRKAPLWSQVWEMRSSFRDKASDRKWWGLDFSNPEESPFIKSEEVEFFKASHAELKELHEKNKVGVDFSDAAGDTVSDEF